MSLRCENCWPESENTGTNEEKGGAGLTGAKPENGGPSTAKLRRKVKSQKEKNNRETRCEIELCNRLEKISKPRNSRALRPSNLLVRTQGERSERGRPRGPCSHGFPSHDRFFCLTVGARRLDLP